MLVAVSSVGWLAGCGIGCSSGRKCALVGGYMI